MHISGPSALNPSSPHYLWPDIIMIDGNGVLHPYKCGLASHIGVLLNTPTMGVGKTLCYVDCVDKEMDSYLRDYVAQCSYSDNEVATLLRESQEQEQDHQTPSMVPQDGEAYALPSASRRVHTLAQESASSSSFPAHNDDYAFVTDAAGTNAIDRLYERCMQGIYQHVEEKYACGGTEDDCVPSTQGYEDENAKMATKDKKHPRCSSLVSILSAPMQALSTPKHSITACTVSKPEQLRPGNHLSDVNAAAHVPLNMIIPPVCYPLLGKPKSIPFPEEDERNGPSGVTTDGMKGCCRASFLYGVGVHANWLYTVQEALKAKMKEQEKNPNAQISLQELLLTTPRAAPVYLSVGSNLALRDAFLLVLSTSTVKVPEATRSADMVGRACVRELLARIEAGDETVLKKRK